MTAHVYPPEATLICQLYAAGATPKAIGAALVRDTRTITQTLDHARVARRHPEPVVPSTWQRGLTPSVVRTLQQALRPYLIAEYQTWQQVQQQAECLGPGVWGFAADGAYQDAVQAVALPEPLPVLAQRLGVELSRVLLAYADLAQGEAAW